MTLNTAYIATEKFQKSQIYIGDFYKLWLKLKLTVKASGMIHLANALKTGKNFYQKQGSYVYAAFIWTHGFAGYKEKKPKSILTPRVTPKKIAQILNLKNNLSVSHINIKFIL